MKYIIAIILLVDWRSCC